MQGLLTNQRVRGRENRDDVGDRFTRAGTTYEVTDVNEIEGGPYAFFDARPVDPNADPDPTTDADRATAGFTGGDSNGDDWPLPITPEQTAIGVAVLVAASAGGVV